MAKGPTSPYEPFDRTIRIKVLGRPVELPDNNTLLRGFSYLYPSQVACGKFCWNAECNNSKFFFRLPGDPQYMVPNQKDRFVLSLALQ